MRDRDGRLEPPWAGAESVLGRVPWAGGCDADGRWPVDRPPCQTASQSARQPASAELATDRNRERVRARRAFGARDDGRRQASRRMPHIRGRCAASRGETRDERAARGRQRRRERSRANTQTVRRESERATREPGERLCASSSAGGGNLVDHTDQEPSERAAEDQYQRSRHSWCVLAGRRDAMMHPRAAYALMAHMDGLGCEVHA